MAALRICIFGAGAIGGLLAARLTQTAAEVSVIARGLQLAAIRSEGLRLQSAGEEVVTHRAPRTTRVNSARRTTSSSLSRRTQWPRSRRSSRRCSGPIRRS